MSGKTWKSDGTRGTISRGTATSCDRMVPRVPQTKPRWDRECEGPPHARQIEARCRGARAQLAEGHGRSGSREEAGQRHCLGTNGGAGGKKKKSRLSDLGSKSRRISPTRRFQHNSRAVHPTLVQTAAVSSTHETCVVCPGEMPAEGSRCFALLRARLEGQATSWNSKSMGGEPL